MKQNRNRYEVAVIGGGASGLMAAWQAAAGLKKQGKTDAVILLEGNDRVGKKLLATGNGKCNLSNKDISQEINQGSRHPHFHGDRDAQEVLKLYDCTRIEKIFEELGIKCMADTAGRMYPNSRQAATVLNLLRLSCEENGVAFLCGYNVFSVIPTIGGFLIKSDTGEEVNARKCILASGGKASPKHGCKLNGYNIATKLGHRIVSCAPTLVQVKSFETMVKSLKGVRVKAKVTLLANMDKLYQESGELIFSDRALSGICIFNLSAYALEWCENQRGTPLVPQKDAALPQQRNTILPQQGNAALLPQGNTSWNKASTNSSLLQQKDAPWDKPSVNSNLPQQKGMPWETLSIHLDLLEQMTEAEIFSWLQSFSDFHPSVPCGEMLSGLVQMKLGREVVRKAKIDISKLVCKLCDNEMRHIAKLLKQLQFSIDGLGTFDQAQVTSGGVTLSEIDLSTMESKLQKGFYIAGEILNVHGDCGGYNLHWAWSTGHLAGRSAVMTGNIS